MKLTVLTENTASPYFFAEHGLSYLIEYDSQNILFDVGATDIFLKNAEKLNVKIEEVPIVVLSHGHWDHGGGLRYLKNKRLICHPNAFIKRFHKKNNIDIGIGNSYENLKKRYEIISTKSPYYITENIIFLGEIPRLNNYEAKTTPFEDKNGKEDFIPDDSALVIIKDNELIIVAGCSHSGICNIIEYAKKITDLNKVKAVIGGFHLKKNNSLTKKTIEYFKNQEIAEILPSHCTQFPALAAFYNEFKIKQVKTGMIFQF